MPNKIEITKTNEGLLLPIQAQPGARKNGIVGIHNGRLKVAVTQAPEKGKANAAIVKALANGLGIRRSDIEIVKGLTSPQKTTLIGRTSLSELEKRLAPFCD